MSGQALVERRDDWTALHHLLLAAERDDTGATLTYAASPELAAVLADLVEAETACCGGSGVDWSLDDTGDHLTVRIAVPPALADHAAVDLIWSTLAGPVDQSDCTTSS